MSLVVQTKRPPARPLIARPEWSFSWYIGAALAVAVAGGFALALALPLAAALGLDWGVRWRSLVQAHGHLQIVGFTGLFIVGMGFRLAPRFTSQPLRLPAVTGPTLGLLVFGLLGRAVAQPWLDIPGFRALLTAAALAELAAALLFAASVGRTLAPAVRTLPSAPFMFLGVAGFAVQALLGVLWLPGLTADTPVLAADRSAALLTVQFYAFVLPFVLGVSLRALPTFFAVPGASSRQAVMLTLALALGTALGAAGSLAVGGATGVRVSAAGTLLLALGIAGVVQRTGVWREAERLRPDARHPVLLIKTAFVWLALTALVLAWGSVASLIDGRPVPPWQTDLVRHTLALGVFTSLIVAMGGLMLPWLAMRRQRPNHAHQEARLLWALLTGATALRVAGAILEGQGIGTDRFWPMAVAGVLGIAAVGYFAVAVLRAARQSAVTIAVQEKLT